MKSNLYNGLPGMTKYRIPGMRKLVASFYTFIFLNAVLERVSKFPLSCFPVLNSLKESYEQALRRDDVKAIVVTGKI